MELPKTSSGNSYVVVFQDLFTKWPFVFPVPDQQSIRIVRLLTEHIVPFCGVPEALLSDHGANLLSHLMLDVCKSLGIRKLNTTAYHPQCDGVVERFNRTLKAMLRKHAGTLADKGIVTSRGCCGLIVTLPTNLLVKDPHSSYLVWFVAPQAKLAYCQPQSLDPATWTIIEKS